MMPRWTWVVVVSSATKGPNDKWLGLRQFTGPRACVRYEIPDIAIYGVFVLAWIVGRLSVVP